MKYVISGFKILSISYKETNDKGQNIIEDSVRCLSSSDNKLAIFSRHCFFNGAPSFSLDLLLQGTVLNENNGSIGLASESPEQISQALMASSGEACIPFASLASSLISQILLTNIGYPLILAPTTHFKAQATAKQE